ncbi:hypothetical protein CVT25_003126 [Psilocybe cyanescens]|uniref:AMP-dependent synthetase/ligase domain-containing protein n=1 Tax=Psilocybe cyanescens TaxID=93625 RepID=A0A409XQV9_PSICY|nr:hypothetical protein CVT25_003126 [Psilocybe cyanescens]
MTELHTAKDLLPHIPDNLTISQFMLDYQHDIRPIRSNQMSCLVDDNSGHSINFESQLKSQTEDLANGLYLTFKIGEADTVSAPFCRSSVASLTRALIDYPLAMWALHKLGGIVSFSNPQFKADEVAYQLKTARVTYIFVHSSLLDVALEAIRLVGIACSRIIILDELPRLHDFSEFHSVHELMAVVIPHRSLIANIIQMAVHNQADRAPCLRELWTYRPGDVSLGVLPFYRAAPLSMDIQGKLCDVFPAAQIGQAYGLTEMTVTLTMVSGSQKRGSLGSGGRLLPGIQARVLKPDGSFARYGERGELIVKGPGMALGYLHDVAATRQTFIDGWVHTGDEVTMTPDQDVFVYDRLKEFLKVNGFQVAPSELEDCLLSHPDVAEACVIGIPNEYSGEDDVVLVFSRNHVDYPVAIWAVHRLGGVISGANPDYTSSEVLYQLQATKASVIMVDPESLSIALDAAREARLSPGRVVLFDTKGISEETYRNHETVGSLVEFGLRNKISYSERILASGEGKTKLAFLSFSSGTTGRPKAVAIPHFALIANVIQIAAHNKVNQDYCDWQEQRFRPGDIAIGVLPFYHIYGLVINLHYIIFCGLSLVVIPKFNFVEMLNSIVRHRISHLILVPPQVVLLCKHPAVKKYDLRKHIRMIMCGAAPLSHELNQQLFAMFPDAHIGQAYGMTETCTSVTMWPITRKRGVSGSSGHLLPGIAARVVKQDGTLADYGEAGELFISTPSVALGYANNAEATSETFIDGWVRTGDEVKIGEDGEMVVLDRLKEIMKVKGFQVAPAELEGCILDHPDVSNTCVVGIPDEYSGEVPLAYVVLTADASQRANKSKAATEGIKASIIKHVAQNKIHYKHLAGGVEFVSVIPTSPSGKLLRRVLRDQAKGLRKVKAKL